MKTVVFRTNAGKISGLGHLTRCLVLARELTSQGATCVFVLDFADENIIPFLEGFDYHALYAAPSSILNQDEDADKTRQLCIEHHCNWLVVDHYLLDDTWEARMRAQPYKLCVIDDTQRRHACDCLVDYKWRGEDTHASYNGLTNEDADHLVGPSFVLLDVHKPSPRPRKSSSFDIVISLGGGGDFNLVKAMVDQLLAAQNTYTTPLKLHVVVGPLAENSEAFLSAYQDHEDVELLIGKTDISTDLKHANFYIGAAGSTLYQLRAYNIPALTLSLADNQFNELSHLEDLGHYFHLNAWSENDFADLPRFIRTVQSHYTRVCALGDEPRVKIDGKGAKRIAGTLLGDKGTATSLHYTNEAYEYLDLSPTHTLRKVTDRDINQYLISRNRQENAQNMVQTDPIPYLHHYAWWFNSTRESFLLEAQHKPTLFIWHDTIVNEDQPYLIGGWFVYDEKTDFGEPLLALNWQLDYCAEHHPSAPWIAVIHRSNKFTKLLNDYLSFTEIDDTHPSFKLISEVLHISDTDQFYFLTRDPVELQQATKNKSIKQRDTRYVATQ
ncbi:UDP-2,4-diacetamido-2,4,6-trideoxy-beta-L-altropyranose hydrolase [Magnetovibrio sp. PR-2]|uniref:UDP-2,4-diacetamido-2,4, 6-trideoxy-beta-L-altropyranose hydrolase n=1 Tax=Magnetovibrio sp. PR-2 TaxID=3120356 RepID=UPI002FCE29F7